MRAAAQKFTLAQAAALGLDALEDLDLSELDLSPAQTLGACELWAALLGIASDDADGMAGVRREVLTDAPLLVALSLPGVDFVRWFRHAEWEHFERTEIEGGEGWAWRVLDAARGAVQGLGQLAGQVGLAEGLRRHHGGAGGA